MDVLDVKYQCQQTCTFSVTVQHADTGWEHYANRWEILTVDGEILDTRVLGHPHVHEQPFTRSLTNVMIPKHITTVIIRAHDSVDGYGGKEFTLELKR